MKYEALNEYLRFVGKEEFFRKVLTKLAGEVGFTSDEPVLPEQLPVGTLAKISSDYLNRLFAYYATALRYVYAMYNETANTVIDENRVLESKRRALEAKINNIKILLKKLKSSDPSTDYMTVSFEDTVHLPEYSIVDLCAAYVSDEGVSVEIPDNLSYTTKGSALRAIDQRSDTLWHTEVEATGPVVSGYGGGTNGAVLKYVLEFDRAVPINYIKVSPMSLLPMHISSVKFYYGDVEAVLEEGNDATLSASYMEEEVEFRFKTVVADKVEIYFVQEHYEIRDSVEFVRELYEWTNNVAGSREDNEYKKVERIIADVLADVKTLDPEWLNTLGNILGIELNFKPYLKKTRRFVYSFGADTIFVGYITYQPEGYWYSDKHDIDSNIYAVGLETDDNFDTGHILQYYVQLSDKAEIPIIPSTNDGRVRERIFPSDGSAVTTFPVTGDVSVFCNGEAVESFSSEVLSDDTVKITLTDTAVLDNVYYVEYTSDADEFVDVSDYIEPEYIEEELEFDSSGKAVLKGVPYVDMEIIMDSMFTKREDESVYDFTGDPFYSKNGYLFGSYTIGKVYVSSDSDKFYCTDSIDSSIYTSDLYISVDGNTWPVTSITSSYYQVSGDISDYYSSDIQYDYVVGGSPDGPVVYYTPIELYVGDTRALNLTNYEDHSATLFTDDSTYAFYTAGRRVYLNKKPDAVVKVKYYRVVEYLRCKAAMHQTGLDDSDTPVIKSITLKVKPRI